jgi:flagellar FliJ protein
MRKFKFSLDKLLEFRGQKENVIKEQLMLAVKSLNTSRQELVELQHEKETAFNVTDFNVGKMQLQYHYILGLQQKIKQTELVIVREQQIVDQTRAKLVEAQRDCKVLEKLQDKQYDQYLTDIKHREQKVIDEIANRKKFSVFNDK